VFAGKKSAQIREILISESAWEEMTCLFAPSLIKAENKLFAWIFMAAYAAVETLIITRHADHHFAEVFTLQQADKRLWRIL
jgi:hypothetical protein